MIDINDLATEIGCKRQNLNHHILKGRFGDVKKVGNNETDQWAILPENVVEFCNWFLAGGGRKNHGAIDALLQKYKTQ